MVKDHVRLCRARGRETFVPLAHPPGHAQVDFGEAVAVVGGERMKIHYFCMSLPQSDACFFKAYPRETTEAFLDGHVSAFAFFGGVPLSILYDNTTIAVAKICGDGTRERTRAFTELVSHYLFQDRFARPARGNDKGKVEGLVKFARNNFMVPVPVAANFDVLNARFEESCRTRQGEHAGQHAQTIAERLAADVSALRTLPSVPLEPCEKRAARVSSTAMVRYRTNDYSVPTAYGYRDVMVGEWQTSPYQAKGSKMIRYTLSKLKAWFSPAVPSTAAKPVAKGKSSPARTQPTRAAKTIKRRAQRQARARNR